jgi:Rrf2 family nitric oxide-sensitive transcriptional repressor
MRLNKSTGHAIRILIECARSEGELVKVADLASALDLTMQNVFKIVHLLSRNQLLAATRGRNGGVALARPADQIRMGDIVRAMEATEIELDVETSGKRTRKAPVNGVNRVLDTALEAFVAVLDQHTLADMAQQPRTRDGGDAPGAPRTSKSPQSRSAQAVSGARLVSRSSGN